MTDTEKAALEQPPHTVMERIATLERQVELLLTLAYAVHGLRWMNELKQKKDGDGPPDGK